MIALYLIWRIWYYVLGFVVLILILPLFFIFLISGNIIFFWLGAKIWARAVFYGMGYKMQVEQHCETNHKRQYIVVANHSSEMDIMAIILLMKKPTIFVGKKELSKLPIFGYFYKKTMVLVDRSSYRSKKMVISQVETKLKMGLNICIFPEGMIPNQSTRLGNFKDGAFMIGAEKNLPLLPITIADLKEKFPPHTLRGSIGKVRIYVHEPIEIYEEIENKKIELKKRTRKIIESKLKEFYLRTLPKNGF